MKIINKDITTIDKGIIIHQANNKRVMGAGVAKAIIDKYPKHKEDYLKALMKLSNIVYTKTGKYTGIFAIITQNGYGRNNNIVYTDYEAFKKALIKIDKFHNKYPGIKLYMPYKIGCGLANGDWNIISNLIENTCPYIILCKKK